MGGQGHNLRGRGVWSVRWQDNDSEQFSSVLKELMIILFCKNNKMIEKA